MSLYKYIILGTTAITFMVPAASWAQDVQREVDRGEKRFERLDANKDGKISLEEMLGVTTERFQSADSDSDGEITVDEMVAQMQRRLMERRAKRRLARMDFNGDGKVTQDEIENRTKKRFALMDRNDDGVLEKAELRRAAKHRRAKNRRWRKHHRRHGDTL